MPDNFHDISRRSSKYLMNMSGWSMFVSLFSLLTLARTYYFAILDRTCGGDGGGGGGGEEEKPRLIYSLFAIELCR